MGYGMTKADESSAVRLPPQENVQRPAERRVLVEVWVGVALLNANTTGSMGYERLRRDDVSRTGLGDGPRTGAAGAPQPAGPGAHPFGPSLGIEHGTVSPVVAPEQKCLNPRFLALAENDNRREAWLTATGLFREGPAGGAGGGWSA
jgi:hypothetical protein